MKHAFVYSSLLLACLYTVATAWEPDSLTAQTTDPDRIEVVDGDTIRIGDDRYRLLGFDTPETRFAQCESERDLGNQATRRLKQLIATGSEAVLHIEARRDRYDRFLARLEVNGQDVGPVLISEGLARPYQGGQRGGWC